MSYILLNFGKNPTTMNSGIVKFYNDSKGFGFIKEKDSGQEYFVHVSGLKDKIKENDPVTFALKEGKKLHKLINDFSKSIGNKKDAVEEEKRDKSIETIGT